MTDAWKARYLPASFRGIPFYVDSHDFTAGRNIVGHEIPGKDTGQTEDVGRKLQGHNINAYVMGDTYFFIRDALIDAFEDESRGILIHPYLGTKEVQPGTITVSESVEEGRLGRLTMTFAEAGEASFPFSAIDAVTDFLTTVVTTVARVQNGFQVLFSLAAFPGLLAQSGVSLVTGFTDTIRNGIKNVRLSAEEQADLERKLDEIDANVEALVENPASLAAETDNAIQLMGAAVADPPDSDTIDTASGRDDKLDVYNPLLALTVPDIPETTDSRIQEKENAEALIALQRQLAAIRLAQAVVEKEFLSIDEAVEKREEVAATLEELRDADPNDDTYQALSDLMAKFADAVPNSRSSLARIENINLSESVPSLVLAYDRYEDPDRESDILSRNRVRNPGFLVGDLEVLSV